MANKSYDIVYLASHGFAVRMVIQTDLLGKLIRRGMRVALISTDKTDATLAEYCSKSGVDLYEFNPKLSFWSGEYPVFRRYLFENIRKNPALWEKHLRMKYSEGATSNRKRKANIYYGIYKVTSMLPFTRKWFSRLERSSLKSTEAENLLAQLNPKYVVSTYPVNVMEAMLLGVANKRENTKSVIHLLSWDNISCKGRFMEMADEYIVWGPIMKQELQQYYHIPEQRIFETGVPHFDLHYQTRVQPDYKKYVKELGLDPERPYLFFAMSSPYFGPREIDIVEKIAEWIKAGTWPGMQFIVRPHPQNMQGDMADFSWLPRLKKLEGGDVAVDYPKLNNSRISWSMQFEDMFRLSQLITGCTVSLNSCSTVTIDSLYHFKPVVLTAFDNEEELPWWQSVRRVMDYEHYEKIKVHVDMATDYRQLKEMISANIEKPEASLPNRMKGLQAELADYSGNATDNVVNVFAALLGKDKQGMNEKEPLLTKQE